MHFLLTTALNSRQPSLIKTASSHIALKVFFGLIAALAACLGCHLEFFINHLMWILLKCCIGLFTCACAFQYHLFFLVQIIFRQKIIIFYLQKIKRWPRPSCGETFRWRWWKRWIGNDELSCICSEASFVSQRYEKVRDIRHNQQVGWEAFVLKQLVIMKIK